MNLGGHGTAVAIAISIDVLMALAFYLPMTTGALFILPIGSMGVGAYTAGELALHGMPLGVIVIGAAACGGLIALIGGSVVVRMGGWSAAIASLAMVEVLQVIVQNMNAIGGAEGLLGIPLFTPSLWTYIITICVLGVLLCVELGRPGDVLEAIRGDELAAACSGLKVRK